MAHSALVPEPSSVRVPEPSEPEPRHLSLARPLRGSFDGACGDDGARGDARDRDARHGGGVQAAAPQRPAVEAEPEPPSVVGPGVGAPEAVQAV